MNIVVNGQSHQVPDGATVAELLERLKFPPRGIAVELNLSIVPRPQIPERLLAEGDRLEVVSLVGGG
jgi:sulfur carrier protein